MKRISLILLPVLLFAALGPFASLAVAARPGSAQIMATPTAVGDGNDCDHDHGHDPADDVCTATPTPTITPSPTACPAAEQGDFNAVPLGASVQGMGAVARNVKITALYSAVRVKAGVQPQVYLAGPGNTLVNAGLTSPNGAFGDVQAHRSLKAGRFTFTFSPGMTITDFRLHMLDYGDWNPFRATDHVVTMSAFNAAGQVVAMQTLSYTTPAIVMPPSSDKYGNMQTNGDALSAPAGMPGNWTWHVAGKGIVRVVLAVGAGPDPNFALDGMYVKFSCP